MRAAVWEGPQEQAIRDIPVPKVGPGDVLVRVKDAGICGSDLFHVTNRNVRVRPPMILGHEVSGTIERVGSDVPDRTATVGMRVALNPLVTCGRCDPCRSGDMNLCRNIKLIGHQVAGGFAEYTTVGYDRVVPIPDTVVFDDACLVEPLAVAVHTFSHVSVQPGDEVVVLGGGPIGLLCAQMARIRGATNIIVTERTDFRLGVIESLGFTPVDARLGDVNDQILAQLDGAGADIVVEAVGSDKTALQMAYLAKPKGQVLVAGLHKGRPLVDLRHLSFGEQTVRSIRLYKDEDFVRAVRLLATDRVDTSVFGTVRLPLEEINRGFDIMRTADQAVKVIIDLAI